jgi:hypothetical protein
MGCGCGFIGVEGAGGGRGKGLRIAPARHSARGRATSQALAGRLLSSYDALYPTPCTTCFPSMLSSLPPRYAFRVRAIDESGVHSDWSPLLAVQTDTADSAHQSYVQPTTL